MQASGTGNPSQYHLISSVMLNDCMGSEKYGSHWFWFRFQSLKNLMTTAVGIGILLVGGLLERIPNLSLALWLCGGHRHSFGKDLCRGSSRDSMKSASMLKSLMLVDDDDNDSLRSAAVMRSSPLGSGSFVWQADASVEVETNATSSRQHDHHHPATATTFAPDTLEQAYGSLFASDDFSTADALLFSDDNEEDDDDSENNTIQVCVQCV
jgi:hypothetical protein